MTAKIHPHTDIGECRLVALERVGEPYGPATVAENGNELPFAVKRIFYIYDIPAGAERGGHSHYAEEQLIIAARGKMDVAVTDGREWRRFTLHRPDEGLYVPPGLWRSLDRFSEGSVVLSMSPYDFEEADYVRDYDEFLKLRGVR